MSDAIPSPPVRHRNHGWIYFFVFVVVSSVGVAGFMIWWNLHIQLKPEQLEKAIALWKEKGPKTYKMVYTKQLNNESHIDKFVVEVRASEVTEVRMNGQLLVKEKGAETDPKDFHSMTRLLRDIERFMDLDTKPGAKKVYVRGTFNGETGALLGYVRRVMGETQRVEIQVLSLESLEK